MKTFFVVVTTTVSDSTVLCLYFGGFSQRVASLYHGLYIVVLLLELVPGATRPSTDYDSNNKLH